MTFQKGNIPPLKNKFGKDGYTHRGRVAKNYIMKKIDAELEERGMKEISKTKLVILVTHEQNLIQEYSER